MRVVNPYKVRLVTSGTTIEDKQIVIPVGETFDGIGQNQQVEDYVEKLADESVNPIVDYEKWRYTPLSGENSNVTTDLGYEFYFYGTPSRLDYKLNEDGDNESYFSSGNNTPTQIVSYTTPSVFTYNLVNNTVRVSLTNFSIAIRFEPQAVPSYTDANAILDSSKVTISVEEAGNVITNDCTISISPKGDSYQTQPTGKYTGGGSFAYWARDFNVVVSYNGSLTLGGNFEIKAESTPHTSPPTLQNNNVFGYSKEYTVYYEATSSETEDYYTDYTASNMQSLYIDNDFKGYTNSFFRLDYYDSVIEESQNLLFTDILTVSESKEPSNAIFETRINKQNYFLYWLKNDPVIEEQGYRDVYMSARFFNASTGLIHQFFNTDEKIPTIDLYETKYRYTKVRLYKDYTYVIEDRTIIEANLLGNISWTVTETLSPGTTQLKLYEIRTK